MKPSERVASIAKVAMKNRAQAATKTHFNQAYMEYEESDRKFEERMSAQKAWPWWRALFNLPPK